MLTPENSPEMKNSIDEMSEAELRRLYEKLHDDYISHNEMMWQTPALAMAAMAFLMTIVLGNETLPSRIIAAFLSVVIAFASAQLMAKHSKNQRDISDWLNALEPRLGMPTLHQAPPDGSKFLGKLSGGLIAFRSRQVWLVTLLIFGVVSLVLLIVFAANPAVLA